MSWLSDSLYRFCGTVISVWDEEPCKMEVLKWKISNNNDNNMYCWSSELAA